MAPSDPSMSTFLVERYLPSVTAADVAAAVTRLGEEDHPGARHLFTVLVLGEETGLSCFEATDREAVDAANRAARFPYDRIIEVTTYMA